MGTHAQLYETSEVYRHLVRRQIMQGDAAEAEAETEQATPGAAAGVVAAAANGTSSNTTTTTNSSSPRGGRTVRASS